MKKILLIFMLFATAMGFSQAPEKMNYQAVVRNADGSLITNSAVGLQISILQTSLTGTVVYKETHAQNTNVNGLVTLEIGTGTVVSGSFATINWASDNFFIKSETDPLGGNNYTISGTSQLLSVPYALHAKTAANVENYKIGDFTKGGIVFWVDQTGQHGLVCTKQNQTASIKWFAGTFGSTQAKGSGLYAGKANNAIVISSHVAIGDNEDLYAARLCSELNVEDKSGSYGDWYLPSRYELNLMYQNKDIINSTSNDNGGDNFINDVYWTSTEESSSRVWVVNFLDGSETNVLKSVSNPVRAIRSF
jgi:hypothetical protein